MLNIPNFKSKWVEHIKKSLLEIGRHDIWLNQDILQTKPQLNQAIKQTLKDQYLQNWNMLLANSSKYTNLNWTLGRH